MLDNTLRSATATTTSNRAEIPISIAKIFEKATKNYGKSTYTIGKRRAVDREDDQKGIRSGLEVLRKWVRRSEGFELLVFFLLEGALYYQQRT